MRIFISHSAKSAEAQVAMAAVKAGLTAKGHDVFIDRLIDPGDEWRPYLYDELARCGGAVVLLGQDTLKRSHWVRRELDILLWRHAFHRGLRILTVVLDGEGRQAAREAGFAELTEAQFLDVRELRLLESTPDKATTDELQARVAGCFAEAPATPTGSMAEWFDNIELLLTRIGHPERMREAAIGLGVPDEDARQVLQPGGLRYLAHQFLGHAAGDARVAAIKPLAYCSDGETLGNLVSLIRPTWVDSVAARPLMQHTSRGAVVLLNASDAWIAREYCARATCLDLESKVVEVECEVGEHALAELSKACENAVKELLEGNSRDAFEDLVQDWVRNGPRRADGTPIPRFLIVRATHGTRHTVAEAVKLIRRRFAWLVVIVLIGTATPTEEEVIGWGSADARLLTPTLAPEAAATARATNSRLRTLVEKPERGRWP